MQRLQAFKFELQPNGEQARSMRRFAGSCRVVFNEALSLQKKRDEQGEKKLGYAGLCEELTAWRNGAPLSSGRTAPWLSDAPVHPLQQTYMDAPGLPSFQSMKARRKRLHPYIRTFDAAFRPLSLMGFAG